MQTFRSRSSFQSIIYLPNFYPDYAHASDPTHNQVMWFLSMAHELVLTDAQMSPVPRDPAPYPIHMVTWPCPLSKAPGNFWAFYYLLSGNWLPGAVFRGHGLSAYEKSRTKSRATANFLVLRTTIGVAFSDFQVRRNETRTLITVLRIIFLFREGEEGRRKLPSRRRNELGSRRWRMPCCLNSWTNRLEPDVSKTASTLTEYNLRLELQLPIWTSKLKFDLLGYESNVLIRASRLEMNL